MKPVLTTTLSGLPLTAAMWGTAPVHIPEPDDDLRHDYQIDRAQTNALRTVRRCASCMYSPPTMPDATLCPDRVKRALDRRFVAGVRAGLEAAARECERIVGPWKQDAVASARARDAIRAIDPEGVLRG
jgi:hypothetical protein